MCAIFGIYGNYDLDKANLSKDILSHRGDDEESSYRGQNLFLSHNLLSINSNSSMKQPFCYKNLIILFNGEIYNFKELAREYMSLESEVLIIAKLYERYREKFVDKLLGMFAIVIIENEKKISIFRDRFGKKPIFYYLDSQRFIFSSEIKAIKPHINLKLNENRVSEYLSFSAPIERNSFYKNINKLDSGEYLVFENFNLNIESYFNILDTRVQIFDRDRALRAIESELNSSIDYRLISNREVGSLLSGGIDSSLISAIANRKLNYRLKTFSIGYDGFKKYDERVFAREVATHIDSEHFEYNFTKDDFFENIDKTIEALDEPINDPASIPLNFLLSKVKSENIDVLLSGEGSDELFLGYRQYFEFLDIEQLSNLKNRNWLRGYFKNNFSINREWEHYKRIFEGTELFRSFAENFTDSQKDMILKQKIDDNESLKLIDKYFREFQNSRFKGDKVAWYSYIDLKILIKDVYLAKVDRVSMANTIEVRNPFLDQNLVKKVFEIDSSLKLGDTTKPLLKDIAKKYLPERIIARKKKGFSYPFIEWLHQENELNLIYEVNRVMKIFNENELTNLLKHAKRGRFKQHIFGIYLFCRWVKLNGFV